MSSVVKYQHILLYLQFQHTWNAQSCKNSMSASNFALKWAKVYGNFLNVGSGLDLIYGMEC
jgi:hypothetical protein